MYKPKIVCGAALVLLMMCLCLTVFAQGSRRLSVYWYDDAAYAGLKDGRLPPEEDPVITVFANGHPLAWDEKSRLFYYSVAEDDRNGCNPEISFLGIGEAKMAFSGAVPSMKSIRQNQTVKFLIYTESTYYEYGIVMTTLPVMQVTLAKEPAEPESPIGDTATAAKLQLFDNRAGVRSGARIVKSDALLHIRGASSRAYPQKSYRVSLVKAAVDSKGQKNDVSMLGMRKDDDWILYAPYNDPEKIRNTLATNLWWDIGARNNLFAVDNGAQGRFVELLIDGRYWGIYTLTHPIDAKQLDIEETDDPLTTEYLYRTISHEVTTSAMFRAAVNDSIAGRFELREPDTERNTYLKWAPVDDFHTLLEAPYEEFAEKYTGAVDLENAVDIWLYAVYTLAIDNNYKNLVYTAKQRDGRYVMLFAPWDLDETWGNIWTETAPLGTEVVLPPDFVFLPDIGGIAVALSMDLDGIVDRIQKRYAWLRSSILSDDNVTDMLRRYENDVYGSGAILRNQARWPQAAYAMSMDAFQAFVMERLQYVDSFIRTIGR